MIGTANTEQRFLGFDEYKCHTVCSSFYRLLNKFRYCRNASTFRQFIKCKIFLQVVCVVFCTIDNLGSPAVSSIHALREIYQHQIQLLKHLFLACCCTL